MREHRRKRGRRHRIAFACVNLMQRAALDPAMKRTIGAWMAERCGFVFFAKRSAITLDPGNGLAQRSQ
jgi:hypothetical protein